MDARVRHLYSVLVVTALLLPQTAAAVGGDDCPSATMIPGPLPYTDTSSTCIHANWYGEVCPSPDTSPDAVYTYTPTVNECVDITLCNTGSGIDFKLYVYASDAGGCPATPAGETALDIACDDGACPPYASIAGLALTAGVQYWIVVDGSGDVCGNYRIDVAPCGTLCQGPGDCDDGLECTANLCNMGSCEYPPLPLGAPCGDPGDTECDDPNTCDGAGACQDNHAPGGAPCGDPTDSDCDHPDTCDGVGGCQGNVETDGVPCDDGVFCNDGEACTAGVCGGGSARDCDDAEPCTNDFCDEANVVCGHPWIPGCCNSDADCDNGLYCDGTETYLGAPGGTCQPGSPPDCDDADICTSDGCDEGEDVCDHVLIQSCCLTDQDCDDGNPCTVAQCNLGVCVNPPAPAGTPCGNPAGTGCSNPDTCDQAGVCQPNDMNEGGACDDNDPCTDGDTCLAGKCTGTPNGVCEECEQTGPGTDPLHQISFQALLKDALGDPVSGPVDLSFWFYDLSGTQQGEEIVMSGVPVSEGIMSVALPIEQTIFDGIEGRELGVSVNGTPELTPRIALTSAPQAFRVNCASGREIVDHLVVGSSQAPGRLEIRNSDLGGLGRGTTMDVGGYIDPWSSGTTNGDTPMEDSGVLESFCDNSVALRTCGVHRVANSTGNYMAKLRACRTEGLCGGGQLLLYNQDVQETVILEGQFPEDGEARITVKKPDGTQAVRLKAMDDNDLGGMLVVFDDQGERSFQVHGGQKGGSASSAPFFTLQNAGANTSSEVDVHAAYRGGAISLTHNNGIETVEIVAAESSGAGPQILLRNTANQVAVEIDGDAGGTGEGLVSVTGTVETQLLRITGGCDLSEQFDIQVPSGRVEPGTVVSIDTEHPGGLVISSRSYDRRVAGIVSGAGGVNPGMLMSQAGSRADGDHPVALTGRVYVWADATNGAIEPGDLLTTSSTPGHAMKVSDHDNALGAILGKAMTSLREGKGLVLVLVSLQ
ncbi:MAG: hypothetical protein GY778_19800 [bacterium]|nr:hypothetical protein [bacterium]